MTGRIFLAASLVFAAPIGVAAQDGHGHGGHASHAAHAAVKHPEPRAGITADRVVASKTFAKARARKAYEKAAAIPHVIDGIYCHCDCHDRDGLRSLLECFENEMASSCGICRGSLELAYELHEKGKSLEQIRTAVDAKYGPGS